MFELTMEYFSIGPLQFRFYSLLILAGIGAGVIIAQKEAKRYGEDPSHIINIAVIGAAFAIVGARLYHVFDFNEWPYYRANPDEIFQIWDGGIGIFGAIAGAILGLIVYLWWVNRRERQRHGRNARKLGILRWLDIGAPAFLLGQAIGRWGNFFNQELFGRPTDLPWGIPIDPGHRPLEYATETHFHPLFLYESILSLIGVVVLLYVARRFSRRLIVGDILLLYFVWYGGERFLLEFMRFDNWMVGPIPMAQVVGVLFIVVAIGVMVWRHKTYQPPPAEQTHETHATSRSASRRRRRRLES